MAEKLTEGNGSSLRLLVFAGACAVGAVGIPKGCELQHEMFRHQKNSVSPEAALGIPLIRERIRGLSFEQQAFPIPPSPGPPLDNDQPADALTPENVPPMELPLSFGPDSQEYKDFARADPPDMETFETLPAVGMRVYIIVVKGDRYVKVPVQMEPFNENNPTWQPIKCNESEYFMKYHLQEGWIRNTSYVGTSAIQKTNARETHDLDEKKKPAIKSRVTVRFKDIKDVAGTSDMTFDALRELYGDAVRDRTSDESGETIAVTVDEGSRIVWLVPRAMREAEEAAKKAEKE